MPLGGPAPTHVAEERAVVPREARIRGHDLDHGLRGAPVGLVVVAPAEHVVVDATDVRLRYVDVHAAMRDPRGAGGKRRGMGQRSIALGEGAVEHEAIHGVLVVGAVLFLREPAPERLAFGDSPRREERGDLLRRAVKNVDPGDPAHLAESLFQIVADHLVAHAREGDRQRAPGRAEGVEGAEEAPDLVVGEEGHDADEPDGQDALVPEERLGVCQQPRRASRTSAST